MFKMGLMALGLVGGAVFAAPAMAQQRAPAATVEAPRTDREKRAAEILHQMLPRDIADSMASKRPTGGFGGEMSRLAVENSYEQLWTRPGLTLRERSMVTIAMLIGIGNDRELKVHIESALRNGVTPSELEEIIYHATAYAGFPRASDAMAVAKEVVARERPTR